MAVTTRRDYLYSPRGRMRVSVYKELGINYSTRTKDRRFGDKNGALPSYNHLYNYLTRTKNLRLRPKRCRPNYTARKRPSKTITTLFTTGAYRRESKRYRPNLLPIIHTYGANWEHLGEKEVITRTRGSVY